MNNLRARISAHIKPEIKKILEEEAEKRGISQTEYLERLIEGTLSSRLEEKIESLKQLIIEQKNR